MAVAMGLPRRKVMYAAARNAILPSIANLSLAIGLVVYFLYGIKHSKLRTRA